MFTLFSLETTKSFNQKSSSRLHVKIINQPRCLAWIIPWAQVARRLSTTTRRLAAQLWHASIELQLSELEVPIRWDCWWIPIRRENQLRLVVYPIFKGNPITFKGCIKWFAGFLNHQQEEMGDFLLWKPVTDAWDWIICLHERWKMATWTRGNGWVNIPYMDPVGKEISTLLKLTNKAPETRSKSTSKGSPFWGALAVSFQKCITMVRLKRDLPQKSKRKKQEINFDRNLRLGR